MTTPSEVLFARLLEACATGASVHESILTIVPSPAAVEQLGDVSQAACDVAAEMLEQGLDPDDLDPSWMRLRRHILGQKETT